MRAQIKAHICHDFHPNFEAWKCGKIHFENFRVDFDHFRNFFKFGYIRQKCSPEDLLRSKKKNYVKIL